MILKSVCIHTDSRAVQLWTVTEARLPSYDKCTWLLRLIYSAKVPIKQFNVVCKMLIFHVFAQIGDYDVQMR